MRIKAGDTAGLPYSEYNLILFAGGQIEIVLEYIRTHIVLDVKIIILFCRMIVSDAALGDDRIIHILAGCNNRIHVSYRKMKDIATIISASIIQIPRIDPGPTRSRVDRHLSIFYSQDFRRCIVDHTYLDHGISFIVTRIGQGHKNVMTSHPIYSLHCR